MKRKACSYPRMAMPFVSVAALGCALVQALPAMAQDAAQDAQTAAAASDAPMGGDIVVTARRRNETLMSVPVAVTAIGSAEVNRYAATDLTKIAQLAPQVVVEKSAFGGSGAILAIRGIGSAAFDSGLVSSVSVNVDGTQISRGRLVSQGFFDLQQVEVLKGPQALFFGKNSPAGVISLKSAGPTKTFQGYVRAGYEFKANERYVEGAISGPITDTLGFRLALRGDKMDGWEHLVGGPFDVASDPGYPRLGPSHTLGPDSHEFLGRLTLAWNPTDDFSAILRVFGSKYRDNAGPNSTTEIKCADPNGHPHTVDFLDGSVYEDPYGDCRINGRNSMTDLPAGHSGETLYPGSGDGHPYNDYHAIISSLALSYNAGPIALNSTSSYVTMRTEYLEQSDASGVGINWAHNIIKSRMFSQELRASSNFEGPLNGMIGAYYEDEKTPFEGNSNLFNFTAFSPGGVDPRNGRYDTWNQLQESHNRTFSVFGQLTYKIVSNVELSGGARYTTEKKTAYAGNDFVHLFAQDIESAPGVLFLLPEGEFLHGRIKNHNVSPEVTLSWHPTRESTIYAAYKTGYKSGGFSQPAVISGNFTADTLKFKPEKARGFEIGAKSYLLDNKLRLTLTGYRYKFIDLQVQTFDPSTASFNIGNAASARATGVEFDANYALTHDFQLRGAFAYNDAKYLSFINAQCYPGEVVCSASGTQNLSGRSLPRAPKVNLSAGFTYDKPISDGLNLGLSADTRHSSAYNAQETENPVAHQSGYWIVNANLSLHRADDGWDLSLIGRNLTNKLYMVSSLDKPFGAPGEIAAGVSRPREIVLQGTYRF